MVGYGIKPTLKKGVAKVPVVMQLEALECGAAALAMVMAYYGKWVPLEQVRADCGVSRDGSNAKNIYKAAENYGFDVRAYKKTPENLKKEGGFPCIIHWNMNHFVVLNGFKNNKAYLNDPARGEVSVSWEEFDESFTGIVILPVPSESFTPEGKPKSTLGFAKRRLKGLGSALMFVMVTSIIIYLFGIINSATSGLFMDKILTGTNKEWLAPFIFVLVVFALLEIIVTWIQCIYTLKIDGRMAVVGSSSYMWKVLRLPMEFFSQRLAGDIQRRLEINAEIAKTLVETVAPLFLNSGLMVIYLVLMVGSHPVLTLIGVAAISLNIIVSRMITKRRINISRILLRDEGKLDAVTASGIQMIETIKASGAENGFFRKWAGNQAAVGRQNVEVARTENFLGLIPELLANIANYIVLAMGIFMAMQGSFTLGMLMMFQGLLSSFMQPAMQLISAGQLVQEMRVNMERVEDVMQYPEDESVTMNADADVSGCAKLTGEVELKNVTFGYSKLAPPVIENFSLNIRQGEKIAIVGASGCGKSTISKLVSGLYQPWSGEILFGGKPRSAYPREVMTGSLAVVDQDIILFEDTISNNIKMWDDSIKDFEVIMAARDAKLHDDIMQLPGGYHHKLSSDGRDLSGGQRQRLEIARVLAQDPTLIILDEATSALDARTEYEVVKSIRERGITCIVIAHRLSTVRDCDEIIVLDHGEIAERGTHDELIKKNGAYAKLVASE